MSNELNPTTGLQGKTTNKNLQKLGSAEEVFSYKPKERFIQPSIGVSESKYNLLPRSAFFNPETLEKTRAANQPFHHEMGNAFLRLGAEIVGGTMESVGYLSELAQGNAFAVDSENILMDWGRQLKDSTNENFKIYKQNPDGYMFSSHENFWENFISLGSTLSLLLPTLAVGKGISFAGKMLRSALSTTSRGAKVANAISLSRQGAVTFEGVTQAVLSRNIESNMEAYEVYKNLLDQGVSKEIALESAKSSYINNWMMLLQDIPQYVGLGKIFSPRAGKFIDKAAEAGKYGVAKSYLAQMVGEGFEEGYQYHVSQLAEAEGLFKADKADYKGLSDIMDEALTDSQFWNSVTMGAAGGVVFKAVFDKLSVNKEEQKRLNNYRTSFLENRGKRFSELMAGIQEAEERGDTRAANMLKKQWSFEKAVESMVLGKDGGDEIFNQHIEFLEKVGSLNAQEISDLREMGVEINAEKLQEIIPQLIEDANYAKETFDHFLNKTNNDRRLAGDLSTNRYIHREMEKQISERKEELEKIKSKLPGINRLSPLGKQLLDLELEQETISNTIKVLTEMAGKDSNNEAALEAFQNYLGALDTRLEEIGQELEELKEDRKPSQIKRDKGITDNIKKNQDSYQDYIKVNSGINQAEALVDKLDLEYTKLFDERFRKSRNKNKLQKELDNIKGYNLKSLEELEKEYEKNGLLGDTETRKQFNEKRKSLNDELQRRLNTLANKKLDGKQLSKKDLQDMEDYAEMYSNIEKEISKKREAANPKTSEPTTPESSDEGMDESQPQDESFYEVQKTDLYPLIQPDNREQNPTLYDWIESENNKTDFSARFEIVEAFGDKQAVRFTIVDKDGNDVSLNGNPVQGYLRKKNVSALYKDQLNAIIERINSGGIVTLKIKNQIPLMINTKKGTEEYMITDTFGEDVDLYYTNHKGEYVSVKTGNVAVFGQQYQAKQAQAGFFYAGVDGAGNKVPIKLNTKKLTTDQASYVADVIEEMIKQGKNLNENISGSLQDSFPHDLSLLEDLTYLNVIDFFVYMNTKSANKPNELYKSGGILYYGNGKKATATSFDKQELTEFLLNFKRFNVKKDGLSNTDYREFVFANKLINTDKKSGEVFEQPGESRGGGYFYFDTADMTVRKQPESKEAEPKTPMSLSELIAAQKGMPPETEESFNAPVKESSNALKKTEQDLNKEEAEIAESKTPEQNPNGIPPTKTEGTNTNDKKDEFGDELNDDKLDDRYC